MENILALVSNTWCLLFFNSFFKLLKVFRNTFRNAKTILCVRGQVKTNCKLLFVNPCCRHLTPTHESKGKHCPALEEDEGEYATENTMRLRS